ncbi:MAG TPA: DUF6541 family protein [Candidatus Micrarchaeaceae archaeon]|nr:DUF6541 family protein [Candidatus Micrarchaeaceae archaeon]
MAIVSISIWAAVLLLLPGLAIWRLAGPRDLPAALQVAPAFALSLAVIALIGWSCFVLGAGFNGVKAASIAVIVLSAIGLPISLRLRRAAATQRVLPGWALPAAVVLSLVAGLSALYSGPWLSATADTFYHLAAIRAVLQHGTALPQEVFFPTPVSVPDPTSGAWHLALALVSSFSGNDPVTVWRVVNVAVTPLTVLAFFALAIAVTRNAIAALIATVLYTVLALNFDFRDAAYPNRFGLLLAWLAIAFALRYVENGSRRELLVAAMTAFGASAVHPLLSPFLLIAMGGATAAAVVVRSPSATRVTFAAIVVCAAALPLLIVNVLTLRIPAPYQALAVMSPLLVPIIHHPWPWVWPSFWFGNPGIVLGTVFAILLVRLWRAKEVGAGLLIAALLVVPVAALVPLFASSRSGQYLLARVAGVLAPLAWIGLGWGVALAIHAIRSHSRMAILAAAAIVVSALAVAPGFYTGTLAQYLRPASSAKSITASRSGDLAVVWSDRLAAIARLPKSAVILAEPRMAYELAGLTGREVVGVPLSHTPVQVLDGAQRRESALDATQGQLDAFGLAGVIEHYGVTDVLVDMDRTDPAAWAQLATAGILSPIASGNRWQLYSYDPLRLDGYLNLPQQAGPLPDFAASGIGPQPALAGRAVFARLQSSEAIAGQAVLRAESLDSNRTFSRSIELAGGGASQTFALPIPTDAPVGNYRLSIELGPNHSVALGRFDVGLLYQAEDMGGVIAGDAGGWSIAGGSAYQDSLSATASQVGSTASQPVPPVAAGSYCISARVYDYGTGETSAIEAGVGSAVTKLSWSGPTPGMRWVRGAIVLDRPSGQLGMRLLQRGQKAVIVDSLELDPLVEGQCASG